jgi:hypothetical protein
VSAQTTPNNIIGEYYLSGVMETASGFQLNADSSFQFFFSYGALDRYGSGKWHLKDNKVVFVSREKPASDFKTIAEKKTDQSNITIRITDKNGFLTKYVSCALYSNGQRTEWKPNERDSISFPKQPIDSIALVFEFCPEKISFIKPSQMHSNYFELGFEPWILEIFLDHFSISITEDGLKGAHPLLDPAKEYIYTRAK